MTQGVLDSFAQWSRLTLVNLASLQALTDRPALVETQGYAVPGDGGGGSWAWVPSSTATANGGTVVQPSGAIVGRYIRIYSGPVMLRWFGAKGDGSDATAALLAFAEATQGLVNEPGGWMGPGTFVSTQTLSLGYYTNIDGGGARLVYTGPNYAVDGVPPGSGVYPQYCSLSNLKIQVTAPGAVGLRCRFGHSEFSNIDVIMLSTAAGAKGIQLLGDPGGTGPYYNVFMNCSVQGQGASQVGVDCAGSGILYPNANNFYGGRVGQCSIGIKMSGQGNCSYGMAIEGCPVGIEFDFADACNVFGGYIESLTVAYRLTADTANNRVTLGAIDSIGTLWQDEGTNNSIHGQTGDSFPAGIIGVTDGSEAVSGMVGEVISASRLQPQQVTLSNNVGDALMSISLTAGDWDVWGTITFAGGTSIVPIVMVGNINTTENLIQDQPSGIVAAIPGYAASPFLQSPSLSYALAPVRVLVDAPVTYYLNALAAFSGGANMFGWGSLYARRIR